ncbi:hypothetical protein GX48_03278 [Paracoccidioides brasiliensis]|nr:hypothetical protein GX48_03278 [Paracoccidioides brasiliensis]
MLESITRMTRRFEGIMIATPQKPSLAQLSSSPTRLVYVVYYCPLFRQKGQNREPGAPAPAGPARIDKEKLPSQTKPKKKKKK